jgi:hypothetical protein
MEKESQEKLYQELVFKLGQLSIQASLIEAQREDILQALFNLSVEYRKSESEATEEVSK